MQPKDKNQEKYDKYWHARKTQGGRYRHGIIASWIKPGSAVLDVGSGDGALAMFLRDHFNCKVTCLDVSEVAVRRARDQGLDAEVFDIEKPLPFPDGKFDFVIASEVIEHVARSEDLMNEMGRVSRGNLVISIPNTAFWRDRLSLLTGYFPKQWVLFPHEHLRFWSVADFKNTIRKMGYDLESVKAGSGRRWLRDIWPSMFARQVCYKIKIPR